MELAEHAKRPSEDDVIVLGNDSDGDQPAAKTARKSAEPVASSSVELQREVAELKEKLSKSEKNFVAAFEYGREARQRAENAETQLRRESSSLDLIERQKAAEAELRKEMAEMTKKLETATRNERQLLNNNSELSRQNEFLNAEVADLKRTIGQSTKDFHAMQGRLQEKIQQLSYQLGQYEQWIQQYYPHQSYPAADWRWAQQLQHHQQQYPAAADSSAMEIEQPQSLLELQLQPPSQPLQTQLQLQPPSQPLQTQLQPLPPPQPQCPTAAAPVHPPAKVARIYDTEHSTNILQLFRAGLPKSVGLDSALWHLKAMLNECGTEKLYLQLRMGAFMELDCEVCEKKMNKYKVLTHFFSSEHVEKVRAHGAAVSLAAYQFWMRLLQEAVAVPVGAAAAAVVPAAQLILAAPAAQQVAAAAPSVGMERSLEEVKKEEPGVIKE